MKPVAFLLFFMVCLIPLTAQNVCRVNIESAGPVLLEEIKNLPGLEWWVEVDRTLLVSGDQQSLDQVADFLTVEPISGAIDPMKLEFVSLPLPRTAGRVLATGGRFAVVERVVERPRSDISEHKGHFHHGVTLPFRPNTVLACRVTNRQLPEPVRKMDEIDTLLAAINPTRWYFDMFDLQCKDRNTFGEQIDEARDLLLEWFQKAGLQPFTQDFPVGNVTAQNVIAILEGTERPDDIIIVGAHYDSIARDSNFAPGAEDNASGTAAVLEMARIFAANPPPATMIFICFSGEEQNLFGSTAHAASLVDQGAAGQVRAVLNMDMIGYTAGQFDVLLESSSANSDLVDVFSNAAATYTNLNVAISFNPFGSDHVPYLNENMPALLVIEDDWDTYPGYHRGSDVIDLIGTQMGHEVMKMNIAALYQIMQQTN